MMMSAAATAAAMMVMPASVAVMAVGEKPLQKSFPAARNDDMVVADRGFQEVFARKRSIVKKELDLGTAEVGLMQVPDDLSFSNEGLGEISGHLEDGDVPLGEMSADADTDARFEMRVQSHVIDDIKGNGTVGEDNPACLWIDA